MKSEWKWFVPVALAFVLGGTLLGARSAANHKTMSANQYPAPEVSVAAQRIVLPWEVAMQNPEVRDRISDSPYSGAPSSEPRKKKRHKKKKTSVAPGPMDQEMGLMAADDPDLAKAEHYSPKEDEKPAHYEPEWKDWAPD